MASGYLRAHVRQQHAPAARRREQPLTLLGAGYAGGLPGIARRPKTPRFLQVNQTPGHTLLTQTNGGAAHLAQLIAATGNQQHWLAIALRIDQQRSITGQLLSLFDCKSAGLFTLGHQQAREPAALLIDARQQGQQRVVIGWQQNTHDVVHLAQQRLAEGGVLVRLLVLAVLPGVRGGHQRPAQPAGWTSRLLLLTGEDQTLAHGAEHLHAKRLVAGHQIQAALIGQTGRHHSLLVECGDHRAVQRLQLALGLADTMLERCQHTAQTVAGQFVRVADTRPQLRVGAYQIDEITIQRTHGRTGPIMKMQRRLYRLRRLTPCQRVVPFQHTTLAAGEQIAGVGQRLRLYPQGRSMLVEQLARLRVESRAGR